jgi:hypothetical protein
MAVGFDTIGSDGAMPSDVNDRRFHPCIYLSTKSARLFVIGPIIQLSQPLISVQAVERHRFNCQQAMSND